MDNTRAIGGAMFECAVLLYETKAYFASTESCSSPGFGVSMSDVDVVLAGDNSFSVEGQDSAKTGCPSVAAKRCSHFSRWLSGFTEWSCGLDRCLQRTGLNVCKKKKKHTIDMFTVGKKNLLCLGVNLLENILFFSPSLTGAACGMGDSVSSPTWMLAGRDSALWTQVHCKDNTYDQL